MVTELLKKIARRVLREELRERDHRHAIAVARAAASATSAVMEHYAEAQQERRAFNEAHADAN